MFREGFPGITDRFEWFAIEYTGTFYVTVLIARLVSLYSTGEPRGSAPTILAHAPVTSSKESPP